MNINEFTTGPLKSVADLIELYDSLHAVTLSHWAFRGQPSDFGTLVPYFQREFTRQMVGAAEVIEQSLIDAFREHYQHIKDRSTDMPYPDQIAPGFDLRCLSVMQHYEIPTRLLDWTSSFWTAIYFASLSHPDKTAELWIYDRRIFRHRREGDMDINPFADPSRNPPPEPPFLGHKGTEQLIELDPQITPRMKQQLAHHTVSTNIFSDHAPLLYEMDQRAALINGTPTMRRVLIDASFKGNILQFLARFKNITASTIYPDVVGLGRFLRSQYDSLRTMLL